LVTSLAEPVSDLKQVSKKTLKNISPPGKEEGNTTQKVHNSVSPKITFMGDCNTQLFAV
jgi:hypothetical protein